MPKCSNLANNLGPTHRKQVTMDTTDQTTPEYTIYKAERLNWPLIAILIILITGLVFGAAYGVAHATMLTFTISQTILVLIAALVVALCVYRIVDKTLYNLRSRE